MDHRDEWCVCVCVCVCVCERERERERESGNIVLSGRLDDDEIITETESNLVKSKVGDRSRGRLEGVGEGATPFPGLLHFTLDTYLILLSIKQGGIKYHF